MHKHPNHFQLGKVLRTHGLAGDLVCLFDTEKPEAYAKLKSIFIESGSFLQPFSVRKITFRPNDVLLAIDGYNTPEQAAKFKGADIYLNLEALPKAPKNEFYLHDLVGCTIIDAHHGELGIIESVIETTGQNLLAFTYQGSEVLVPFVDAFVKEINLSEKKLHSELPEGLLELYLETKPVKDDGDDEVPS